MGKIALASDSSADLKQEDIKRYNVHTVPLSVIFGEEAYKENIDIDTVTFYEKVRMTEKLPTTTQPAAGDFVEMFEKLVAEGYTDVILVTLSSVLSGTHQTARSAGEMVEGLRVHLVDSEIAAHAEGFFVLEAGKMIEEGKSVEEILERMEVIRKRSIKAYFMVDDLNHLHRGGRVSGTQALIGSLLKVKPILTFKEKTIIAIDKVRTKKKAIQRIKDMFAVDADTGISIRAQVITSNRPEDAQLLVDWIAETYPNVEVDSSLIGAVVGTHVGEGTVAIVWYQND